MAGLIDIASVADQAFLVEHCHSLDQARWIQRDTRTFGHPERNPFLQWKTMSKISVRSWRVRDVVLDASTMLLLKDGCVIAQSNYQRSKAEIETLQVDSTRLEPVDPVVPVLIGGDCWCTNHYHWMNHSLPAIDTSVARNGVDGICLATLPLRDAHERTLQLLGCAPTRRLILEPGRQYAISEVEFSAYTVGVADFSNAAVLQSVHDRLGAAVPDLGVHPRKIYISRLGATHRRMKSEANLIAMMRARGFAIIDAAALSLEDQIRTFRAADLIVAPHGAGLANISFCRPDAEVYELLPKDFAVPCNMVLSIRRGTGYWADAFDANSSGPKFLQDWDLDVAAVMARLDDIEGTGWRVQVGQALERFRNMRIGAPQSR